VPWRISRELTTTYTSAALAMSVRKEIRAWIYAAENNRRRKNAIFGADNFVPRFIQRYQVFATDRSRAPVVQSPALYGTSTSTTHKRQRPVCVCVCDYIAAACVGAVPSTGPHTVARTHRNQWRQSPGRAS